MRREELVEEIDACKHAIEWMLTGDGKFISRLESLRMWQWRLDVAERRLRKLELTV